MIDLSLFYDVSLRERLDDWKGKPGKELRALPSGLRTFGGVPFDVRGVVELAGTALGLLGGYRQAVTNIPVQMSFRRLHCLMATGWSETTGKKIGGFALHYADGQDLEIPITYGSHVCDWIVHPGDKDEPLEHAVVAWTGQNDFTLDIPGHARLYRVTW